VLSHLALTIGALHPEPDPARSWVERELSRPEYHRSLLERFLGWLSDLLDGLRLSALGASSLSTAAAVLVLVVLAVLVVLVVAGVRREPPTTGEHPVLVAGTVTPEQHRAAAETALAEGRFDRAVVEAFRALGARAVLRGLLEERPGLTAHELAADLAPVFPEHAERLSQASLLFDEVFYGDQPTSAADARSVLELDEGLRLSRPGRSAPVPVPSSTVPR
jgi:Domain of unknown function (DUF4129)